MKRKAIGLVAAILVGLLAIASAFYGGMKLGQRQVVNNPMQYLTGGQGLSVPFPGGDGVVVQGDFARGEGGQFPGAQGTPGAGMQGGGRGRVSADKITAIDGNTITVSTSNGTVKVIASDTTYVQKYMSVTVAELEVGDTVVVSGSENADGSITARSIRVMTGLGFFQEDQATPVP